MMCVHSKFREVYRIAKQYFGLNQVDDYDLKIMPTFQRICFCFVFNFHSS